MNEIGAVLQMGFGLVLLWLVFYVGWRPYRLDRVRSELFELRNELFLYAAGGGVSFDNLAYSHLRNRINAVIHYAHTITLTRVVLYLAHEQIRPTPDLVEREREFMAEIGRLPLEAQQKITDILKRVNVTLTGHIVSGAPLLVVIALVYVPVFMLVSKFRSQKESAAVAAGKTLRVELIEEQAMNMAQSQKIDEACELANA